MTDVVATDRYQRALAKWLWTNDLNSNPNVPIDSITDIRFGADGGYSYSEYTQADDYAVIHYNYKEKRTVTKGKNKGDVAWNDRSTYYDISYDAVAPFIEQVCGLMEPN